MAVTKPATISEISQNLLQSEVIIDAPSRLHFSLIDLHGGLGRIDGGLGVALKSPRIKIQVKPEGSSNEKVQSEPGQIPPRIKPILSLLQAHLDFNVQFDIDLLDSIPKHIGLGSNTQLSLAVAKAVTYFLGLDLDASQLARLVSRGGTSGIGVATFENGGFVMDAGHPIKIKNNFLPSHFSDAAPPKLMFRSSLPDDWFFVMTTPFIGTGLHGESEAEIFNKHCPLPETEIQKLSHTILMKLLPAVAEEDIVSFGTALGEIQSLGFKKVENDLQDDIVKELYEYYNENGSLGAGLSSFGPTTYALVEGDSSAIKLKTGIEKFLKDRGIACDVQYTNVDNRGAQLTIND